MDGFLVNIGLAVIALCVVMFIRLIGGFLAWYKDRSTWGTQIDSFLDFYVRVEMNGFDYVVLFLLFGLFLTSVLHYLC